MYSNKSVRILLLALLLVLWSPLATLAQSPEEKGLEIATEADRRDLGFGDTSSQMTMTLRNRQGQESIRKIRNQTLEVEGDGDKSKIIFDEPRDVQGTAFLNYTHKSGPDDQWLYMPALKRVKRIASNNKSGPFMGSEFAFEDISSEEVEKYTYKYLGDEEIEGVALFKVERYPADPKSGYTKQIAWYDQAEYRLMKVDYYDRKDALLKTLTYHEYHQYLEKHWRAHRMEMINHQTGKSTTLQFSDIEFQTGLSEREFEQASLRNAR